MGEFFLTILNMSISASWIVLAVLILRLLLKKAPKWITVLLWGIVAIRLICPFTIESALSLIPSKETINPGIMEEQGPVVQPDFPVIDGEAPPVIGDPIIPTPDIPVVGEPVTPTPDMTTPVNPVQTVITVSSYVWLVGMAGMLAYTVISYFRVKARIGTAVRLREHIFQSESVGSPFVLGLIKPKIYLPFGMDGQDMEYVIAHENAHIRRKDHWWKPVGFLILTLHWFNPLLWLGYVLLCRDIELACDEKVVKELNFQQKADYSQALLNCSVNRRIIAACPLAFGEVGIKERVKSVLNYKKPAFWIIVVAIVASIVTAVCFLTDPLDKKPDDTTQQTDPSDATGNTDPSDGIDSLTEKFLKGQISATNKDGEKVSIQNYLRGDYNKYALYDMSGDAVPELIIKTGEGLTIFSVKEQALTVWYHGTIYEKPLNNRAIFYERPGGAPENTIYQYIVLDHNGEELQRTAFAEYYGYIEPGFADLFGSNEAYFINGEQVSKTAYEDLYKSFNLSDDAIVWKDFISVDSVYAEFLDGYATDKSLLYFTKDIDNNGTKELFIRQNTAMEVYTYENVVKKVGTHDFVTGTLQLYHTLDTKYPGIVYLTVGGGKNHFGYITIIDGALSVKQTFDDDYGMISGKKEDVFYTDDQDLIDLSGKARKYNYQIGYSTREPNIKEDPYPIREITDGRVIAGEKNQTYKDSFVSLDFPSGWKCLEQRGEDGRSIYFQDPALGENCQLSLYSTGAIYAYDRTREEYMELFTEHYGYKDVVIDSFAKETIQGFPCTKIVYSYTKDNTRFVGTRYDNLIKDLQLYHFRIRYPAEERDTYETVFANAMESVQFITSSLGGIAYLPLDEAYAHAVKQYQENPEKNRDICDLQPETSQIIALGGKYYQSYVAPNVDIRYIWISRSEFPDNKTALWDWYPVGSAQVCSLDLLGKIDEGRSGNETDKIDPDDMPLLAVLYNNQSFYCYEGPYSGNVKRTISDYHRNIWHFTIVDMDGDRKNELAVQFVGGDTLILRQDSGTVYGELFGHRGMNQIYKDGVFSWTEDAGNIYGCAKLRFTEEGAQTIDLWRVEHDGSGGFTFYVDDKQVSEAEYSTMTQQYKWEKVVWFTYGG